MKTIKNRIYRGMMVGLVAFPALHAMEGTLSRRQDTSVLAVVEQAVGAKTQQLMTFVDKNTPVMLEIGKQVSEAVRECYDMIERNEAILSAPASSAEQKAKAGKEIKEARDAQKEFLKDVREGIFKQAGVKRDAPAEKVPALEGAEASGSGPNSNNVNNDNNAPQGAVSVADDSYRDIFAPHKRGALNTALIAACCHELTVFYADRRKPLDSILQLQDASEQQKSGARTVIAEDTAHQGKVFNDMAKLLSEETGVSVHDISTINQSLVLATGKAVDPWAAAKSLIYHIASAREDRAIVESKDLIAVSIQAVQELIIRGADAIPKEVVELKDQLAVTHGRYRDGIEREQAIIDAPATSKEQKDRAIIAVRQLREKQREEMAQALSLFSKRATGKDIGPVNSVFAARGLQLVTDGSQDAMGKFSSAKTLVVDIARQYPVFGQGLSDILGGLQDSAEELFESGVASGAAVFNRYAETEEQEFADLEERIALARRKARDHEEGAQALVERLEQELAVRRANIGKMGHALEGGARALGGLGKSIIHVIHAFRSEIDPDVEPIRKQTVEEAYLLSDFIIRQGNLEIALIEPLIVKLAGKIERKARGVERVREALAAKQEEIRNLTATIENEATEQYVRDQCLKLRIDARKELIKLQDALEKAEKKLATCKKERLGHMRAILDIRAKIAASIAEIDLAALVDEPEQVKKPAVQQEEGRVEVMADAAGGGELVPVQKQVVRPAAVTGRKALVFRARGNK